MQEPEGADGELIERLVRAIAAAEGNDWADLGIWVAYAIGGNDLIHVVPDTGGPVIPGSMGERIRRTHPGANRDEYAQLIGERLTSLVQSGMREDFLVRAVRDELTGRLQHLADTEEGDTRREEMRQRIEAMAADPHSIAEFRDHLASADPSSASLSDAQVAERLLELAASLPPITGSQTKEAMDRVTQWHERAAAISDDAIETWQRRKTDRMLRDYRLDI